MILSPYRLSTITFSGGQVITLTPFTKLVIVGPNNVGKSTALEEINKSVVGQPVRGQVVTEVSLDVSKSEIVPWVKQHSYMQLDPHRLPVYHSPAGHQKTESDLLSRLADLPESVESRRAWGSFFVHFFPADHRTALLGQPERLDVAQHPKNPIQVLQQDEDCLRSLSALSERAFGVRLTMDHGGSHLHLRCGDPPSPRPGEDRISHRYLVELRKLPDLGEQGHGVRSFIGLSLHLKALPHTIFLVDEPEAHLHPPQACLLGEVLATEANDRQVIVATHNSHVLRGLIDSAQTNMTIARLSRVGNSCHVNTLRPEDVQRLWTDPLLRHSNILDGLFHDAVIVCEADSDCRFYSAVFQALPSDGRKPDPLFVHCGGKDRIHTVANALRAIAVPLIVVADIDILSDLANLQRLTNALGICWTEELTKQWNTVDAAVRSKFAVAAAGEIIASVREVLSEVPAKGAFPFAAGERVRQLLPKQGPWSHLKLTGKSGIPGGNPHSAFTQLLDTFRAHGLFVVPVGELERFIPSASGHGPPWVAEVLTSHDLAIDAELDDARRFVRSFVDYLATPVLINRQRDEDASAG